MREVRGSFLHMQFRHLVSFSLLLVSTWFSFGCAYRVASSDRKLPEGYKLVAIPVFKNQSHEAGAEVYFTNAMIREMERNRIGKVVPRDQAQVILEGTIENIQYNITNQLIGSSATAELIPQGTILNTAYSIVAVVRLRLIKRADSFVVWEQSFTAEKGYLAPKIGIQGLNSANALYNHSARYENLAQMANELMNEAHGRLTENF